MYKNKITDGWLVTDDAVVVPIDSISTANPGDGKIAGVLQQSFLLSVIQSLP